MDSIFAAQNSHLEDAALFSERDPELLRLKSQKYIHEFSVLKKFPIDSPGLFTLCGPHQSGKTTLLKLWMQNLLKEVPPEAIAFFGCDEIENYHVLERQVRKQIEAMPNDRVIYVLLDDVTSVRDWQKGIKPLFDSGLMQRTMLMLTSLDKTLVQDTQIFFPKEKRGDFIINPLSFRETVLLKLGHEPEPSILFKEFDQYLIHGGYLDAINSMAKENKLNDALFKQYATWLCRYTEKRGKQERYLREILNAVLNHYDMPITWNSLAHELTIDHPKTIGDYFAMLESMGIVLVQYALQEDSLSGAPKKARKLMFTDPFIFHAMQALISPAKNHFDENIKKLLNNPEQSSKLVESCVISQFARYFPTFYIKGEGDVALAYVYNQRFWPIEITWTYQLPAKNLKQILKYSNGRILTKTERSGIIQQIKTEPLPLALWQLEDSNNQQIMT